MLFSIESRIKYYKTFYRRNLPMFELGWSVCPCQALHSSFLPTLVNYDHKKYYNVLPSVVLIPFGNV